jgi:diguanylate cyclase (GGDEF)-like protein/PAS domain S-box-containing protein
MFEPVERSLGAKVVIAVSLVLIVFIAVFSYLDYRNESENILKIYRRNADVLSTTVEKSLISAMKEGRNEDVQKALEDVGTQEDIEGVRVFDSSGNVLRSSNKGDIGGMVDKATLELYKAGKGGEASMEEEGMVLSLVRPIYNAPACFGCHPPQNSVNGILNVRISMKKAYTDITENKWTMAKWGGITVLCVVLAEMLLLRELVTSRVRKLRRAMRMAEKGEPLELDLRFKDEIGELGTVFEGMLSRIDELNSEAVENSKELVRAQEQNRAQSILASVIDAMPDGVAIINRDMIITQHNPRHKEIFPDARVGEPCYFCIHKRNEVCAHCGLVKVFEDGSVHEHHSTVTRPDGSQMVVHSISAPVYDEKGSILTAVEVVRDVTERVNMERDLKEKGWELERLNKKLAKMAVTDGLTMLFNRRYFQDNLTREFRRLARHRALPLLALAMIDIDHFKQLNDKYGHQAGDVVLRNLGKVLKSTVRMTDIIARYGGEEFVIIMPETDSEGIKVVAERIRREVESMETIFDGKKLKTTISVGVASYPNPGIGNEDELVKAADAALYKAKEAGRNRVVMA